MNMMNDVLSGYLDDFVLVFLDDILVYSRTVEQHAEHLGKVLQALKTYRLFAKASKCCIMVREVEFLGQWITPQGAAPTREKIKVVAEWEAPQDLKGVRSFLGFANYYRRFVPGYAELASPLTYLTKKDVQWMWGPPQRQAFRRIKEALCNAPLLQYPNPSLPYVVVKIGRAHV